MARKPSDINIYIATRSVVVVLMVFMFSKAMAQAQTVNFAFTGGSQSWTVPPCVTSITFTLNGGKGGGANGGSGAQVSGSMAVTSGEVIQINVGGQGGCPAAGWNGGGIGQTATNSGCNSAANNASCGGGGATDIRLPPHGLNNRIAVAAGGGGQGGGDTNAQTGAGGCATAGAGTSPFGAGGAGATLTAGGAGGPPWIANGNSGTAGTLGQGGNGGSDPCFNRGPGGGGGGGYYGGGGGGSDCFGNCPLGGGGGGGGTSLVPAGGACAQGVQNGNGNVTITYTILEDVIPGFDALNAVCPGEMPSPLPTVSQEGIVGSWSPAWNPNAPSTYTFTPDPGQCGLQTTLPVTFIAPPVPGTASVQPASICPGENVSLTLASHVGNVQWQSSTTVNGPWSDIAAATQSNHQVIGVFGATYYRALVSNGCESLASNVIDVSMSPVPVANAGPDQIYCTGDPVTLTTGGADNYEWIGMPSLTAISTDATTTIYPTGNVNIMLVAWIGACSDTDYVSLSELPADPIDAVGDTQVCQGQATPLDVVGATAGSSYAWSPALGLSNANIQSPIATPTATTWYVVTVTSPNGCIGIDSVLVTIDQIPVPSFSWVDVCFGEQMAFTSTSTVSGSTIATYDWDFGDGSANGSGSNTGHTYLTAGSFDVTLTVTSAQGCVASITNDVEAHPVPVADFSAISDCADRIIAFNDLSAVSSGSVVAWNWVLGAQQTSNLQSPQGVSYPVSGQYQVQLTVTTDFGCVHDTVMAIDIYPNPTANFIWDDVCLLLANQFTDLSVSAGNYPVVSYEWTFTNGAVSALQNPAVSFNTAGSHGATLLVTDSLGCQDTFLVNNVVVHPLPQPSFNTTLACLNEVTLFTNTSSITSGNIVSNSWDFGDAVTSNLTSPTHTYANDQTYMAQLVATSDQGCVDSITQAVAVGPLPVASFSFANDCLDKLISFTDNSTVPSGSVVGWNWNFGNQATASVQSPPMQQYPFDGFFNVQLAVITDLGCMHDTTMTIEIYPLPNALFSWDSVCLGLPVQFTDMSLTNGNYPIATYQWTFSNGQTSAVSDPSVLFSAAGAYSAELTVTTTVGCMNTINLSSARVHPLPMAQFSNTIKNCLNDTTFFQDLSTVQNLLNDSIVSRAWGFGDGTTATLPNANHLYAYHGFYPVTLSVLTDKGCTDAVTHDVEIFPLPQVDFSSDVREGCQPLRIQFLDETTIPAPYNLAHWLWDLGNGQDSVTAQFPVNIYLDGNIAPMQSAVYTVGLQVTSGNGCVSSFTFNDYITEHPKPTAFFDANPKLVDMNDPKIRFTDLSSINVNSWYWDFGDASSSAQQNPVHTYPDTGSYPVVLYVSTAFGCLDTAEYVVKIEPTFTFYIPNTFTPNSDGPNETFYGQGTGISAYSMMIFNRWGEMLFESNDMGFHWDGTFRGQQVQQGVYLYLFTVTDFNGDPHYYKGHVNLMR